MPVLLNGAQRIDALLGQIDRSTSMIARMRYRPYFLKIRSTASRNFAGSSRGEYRQHQRYEDGQGEIKPGDRNGDDLQEDSSPESSVSLIEARYDASEVGLVIVSRTPTPTSLSRRVLPPGLRSADFGFSFLGEGFFTNRWMPAKRSRAASSQVDDTGTGGRLPGDGDRAAGQHPGNAERATVTAQPIKAAKALDRKCSCR